jgi:hypothetical protein
MQDPASLSTMVELHLMTTALLGRTASHLRDDHDIEPDRDDSLSRRARTHANKGRHARAHGAADPGATDTGRRM